MYKYIDSLVFITENKMANNPNMLNRLTKEPWNKFGNAGGAGLDDVGAGSKYADSHTNAQPTIEYIKGKGINDFKAQMQRGFARPNLFSIDMSPVKASMGWKYRMSCFQAQIPGVTIATTDKDIGFRSVAYQKLFSDITLGFYVSEGLDELKFWQGWIDNIVDAETNHFTYPKEYYSTIDITQISRTGGPSATWTFHDAYPKTVDPIALDYGVNDAIMTANVTLTYRHYTHKYMPYQKNTSIASDIPEDKTSDFQKIPIGLKEVSLNDVDSGANDDDGPEEF
jgi:hypothetical protein